MHAGAIGRKGNPASVGRPVGIEIVGRIIGELDQLSINTHDRDFEVAVPVCLEHKLRAYLIQQNWVMGRREHCAMNSSL
jgi:hypothetical protein